MFNVVKTSVGCADSGSTIGLHRGCTCKPALGDAPTHSFVMLFASGRPTLVMGSCLASRTNLDELPTLLVKSQGTPRALSTMGSTIPTTDALVFQRSASGLALGAWVPLMASGPAIPIADASIRPAFGIGPRPTLCLPMLVSNPCDAHACPATTPHPCLDTPEAANALLPRSPMRCRAKGRESIGAAVPSQANVLPCLDAFAPSGSFRHGAFPN